MAGANVGRVGDIGIGVCPDHTSPVTYTSVLVIGSPTVFTNGVNTGFIGSIGISSCGHPTVALIGSPTVLANSKPVHRVGDLGANSGTYTLVIGSPNVLAG